MSDLPMKIVFLLSAAALGALIYFVASDKPNIRRCELAGGVVMRHHDRPVCVAREGLRFIPIQPEYGN